MNTSLLLKYLRQYQADPTSRVFAPLADQYRKMGKPQEGLRICQEGLQHHSRYAGGRVALAHCLFDLGRIEEALKEYENVLSQYPDNLHAIRGAARCYEGLSKPEKAIRYYRMYLFLVPKDEVVTEHLRALESQLKVTQPPPASHAMKRAQATRLSEEDIPFSALDHFRVSSMQRDGSPMQRSVLSQVKREKQSKISSLYQVLRKIQRRKAVSASPSSRLDDQAKD